MFFLSTSVIVGILLVLWHFANSFAIFGNGGSALVISQYNPSNIVGDMGGLKVNIPRHVAEYVEYDGDPGWSGKRGNTSPIRTNDSKLMSFSFRVRFPNMDTLSSKELWADYGARPPRTNPWLRVGVTTGSHYSGDGYMDRWTQSTLERPDARYWFTHYEMLPKKEFDLDSYVVSGTNPKTGKLYRDNDEAKQIFVSRSGQGQILTSIECSHRGFQPCTQRWSLEYEGVHAEVDVLYTRPLLQHWREIQKNVTQFILDFRATNPAGGVAPPATAASAS
jgi:hypothetical protein